MMLLEGKIADGDTVHVTADQDGLLIEGVAVKAEAA